MPGITLYFLQASRSIRSAWLMEELGVDYNVEFADRVDQKAPQEFKEESGNPLGKFPSIRDGDIVVHESGAIAEYLIEKFDTSHTILPASQPARPQAQIWLHAAEGAFMLHGLAILYARWQFPKKVLKKRPGALEQMEKLMSVNVQNDLDWLEGELGKSSGAFILGGDKPTVADIMMEFSIDFIQERELGTKGDKEWPRIQEWLKACHETESYKRAVQKTGHTLHPETT